MAAGFVTVGIGAAGVLATSLPAAPVASASPPIGEVPNLAALGWQPVLVDDFDGSALDESVWEVQEGPGQNGPGMMTRSALTVSGGVLTLRGYTEGGTHHAGELQTGEFDGGQSSSFLATYGYVEARVRLKTEPGNAHAFWMLPKSTHSSPYGDPGASGPELDIFEHNDPHDWDDDPADGICDWTPANNAGKPCSETVNAGKHWDGFDESHKPEGTHALNPTATPLEGNFHDYSMLWTPHGYQVFVDGQEIHRSRQAIGYQPEYLILSQFVGGWNGSPPTGGYGARGAASNPRMDVDYVKVWQRPISEVPDQQAAANTPLSVPFSVTDHFTSRSSAKVAAPTGSVRVTATSSNQALLPNANVVVTGNGPAAPIAGSLANTSFETLAAPTAWTYANWATSGVVNARTGSRSLRLPQAGGRAEQRVTGLRPNTKYRVGLWHDIGLDWTDTNGNGRIDTGEPVADGDAKFDFGVQDVDVTRTGAQRVSVTRERHTWHDVQRPWTVPADGWTPYDITFTTGPTTTQVTLFADNGAYVGADNDSDVSIDDVYLRPVVPPNRTVTLRPADGQSGTAMVTLTARNSANAVIGTETFIVAFTPAGTFTDGGFETAPARPDGRGWVLNDAVPGEGADVVPDDMFRSDRVLELSRGAAGTASQRVTHLLPGTQYRLDLVGRGALGVSVVDHGGPWVSHMVTTADWSPASVTFTTGVFSTAATIVLLDWNADEAVSQADDVRLTAVAAAGRSVAPPISPPLTWIGAQTIPAGIPTALGFTLPSGATNLSVTPAASALSWTQRSTSTALVPVNQLGLAVNGTTGVLSITPAPDRTGEAVVTVNYTVGGVAASHTIPIQVGDTRLANGGFEDGNVGWGVAATDVLGGGVQRTGGGALRLDGTAEVVQTVTGLHDYTEHLVSGWSRGGVVVGVRRTGTTEVLGLASWPGTAWTEDRIQFRTDQCAGCEALGSASVDIVFRDANPGDGRPVYVDDVALGYGPRIYPIRDISIHQGQTRFDWDTDRGFSVGRVPHDALWDPSMRTVTAADVAGFGAGVVPVGQTGLTLPVPTRQFSWRIPVRSSSATGQRTGRTRLTLQLTDPATGATTSRSFHVTVNAGSSFNNGDFQRSNPRDGWGDAWFGTAQWGVVDRDPVDGGNPAASQPVDRNKALVLSSGVVGAFVEGLAPNTSYTVKLRAKGSGTAVEVRDHYNALAAPLIASVEVAPPDQANRWRDVQVTFRTRASGEGSTSVGLFLQDDSAGVPVSATPCDDFTAGETCIDDIGLFETGDI